MSFTLSTHCKCLNSALQAVGFLFPQVFFLLLWQVTYKDRFPFFSESDVEKVGVGHYLSLVKTFNVIVVQLL